MIIQGIAKSVSVFLAALVCAVAIAGVGRGAAQDQSPPPPQDQSRPDQAPVDAAPYAKMSRDQLGRLVAPIALYPDALVAQILSAATFPTQIADAEDFLTSHPGLSAADLGKQVEPQQWDPSVKALVEYPSVLANLSKNLGWTSEPVSYTHLTLPTKA